MGKTFMWEKTVIKGLRYAVFFGIPYFIAMWLKFEPLYAGLTVGTILTMLANWLKNRNN